MVKAMVKDKKSCVYDAVEVVAFLASGSLMVYFGSVLGGIFRLLLTCGLEKTVESFSVRSISTALIAGMISFAIVYLTPFSRIERILCVLQKYGSRGQISNSTQTRSSLPVIGRLILLIVSRRSREHLTGDIEEEYCTTACGHFKARCIWWWQVLSVIWPFVWARLRRTLGLKALRRFRR